MAKGNPRMPQSRDSALRLPAGDRHQTHLRWDVAKIMRKSAVDSIAAPSSRGMESADDPVMRRRSLRNCNGRSANFYKSLRISILTECDDMGTHLSVMIRSVSRCNAADQKRPWIT